MARRKHPEANGSEDMPGERRVYMERIMDDVARREPKHEALILRLARAGGLVRVEKSILARREYAKRARG